MALAVAATQFIALYVRISVDRAGRREGVERQEKWGRAYVARLIAAGQLPDLPIRVFPDNDLSAFKDDVRRPGYEELRQAIRDRLVAVVWCVEQARLEANRKRWVDLAIEMDEAGLGEIHTDRDGLVRLDEVADIKATLSWHERKRTQTRILETLGDLADEGRPMGAVSYGYRPGRDTEGRATLEVVPAEAAVIRWTAGLILAGWSLTSVVNGLDLVSALLIAGGHPGIHPRRAGWVYKNGRRVSGMWNPSKLGRVLEAPMIAGFRVHKGKIHRRGTWEPILDEVTWRRLCAHLRSARTVVQRDGTVRRVGTPPRTRGEYPLTGLVFCGRDGCGWHLTGRVQPNRRGVKRRLYMCVTRRAGEDLRTTDAGCSRLGVLAGPLEAEVYRRFLARLVNEEFRALFAADRHEARRAEIAAELARIEAQQVTLAQRWGSGDLSDAAWDAARSALDARRAGLNADLAAIPAPLVDVDPDVIAADWEMFTAAEKRHLLGLFLDRVVVLPARPGASKFDPSRVRMFDVNGEQLRDGDGE